MPVAKPSEVLDWPLDKRLLLTLSVCLGVSGLFSVVAAVSSLLLGQILDLLALSLMIVRKLLFGSSFPDETVEVGDLTAAYIAAGLMAGTCTAPLLTAIKRPASAILMGIVAALPYHFFAALVLEKSLASWSVATTVTALLLSVIVGGIVGYTVWEDYDLENRKSAPYPEGSRRPRFKSWRR